MHGPGWTHVAYHRNIDKAVQKSADLAIAGTRPSASLSEVRVYASGEVSSKMYVCAHKIPNTVLSDRDEIPELQPSSCTIVMPSLPRNPPIRPRWTRDVNFSLQRSVSVRSRPGVIITAHA
jgi:hypothetical protein